MNHAFLWRKKIIVTNRSQQAAPLPLALAIEVYPKRHFVGTGVEGFRLGYHRYGAWNELLQCLSFIIVYQDMKTMGITWKYGTVHIPDISFLTSNSEWYPSLSNHGMQRRGHSG